MRKERVQGEIVEVSTGRLVIDLPDGFTLPPDGSVEVPGTLHARLVVDLGDGFTMPMSGTFEVPGTPEFMYDVAFRYRWFEGRFDVVEVRVKGLEDFTVTGEVLRKIPVERILRDYLATTVRPPREFADLGDELVRVAAVYRIAYLAHQPPVQAVAEQLGLPASTAAKKVMAARRVGLLPPTTQGKAGV